MRRSFVRRCGIVLAALALPVLMIGTAASAAAPSAAKLASATLNGDGSTFQLGFNQVVIGAFKPIQKAGDDQIPGQTVQAPAVPTS